jgi:hypothetical protein
LAVPVNRSHGQACKRPAELVYVFCYVLEGEKIA